MTTPGFQDEAAEHGVPFRDRAVFVGYRQFGDPGATTVIVAPEVAGRLRDAAVREHPRRPAGCCPGACCVTTGAVT